MREMKDSGVDWIGEIPHDWEIVQTKRVFRSIKRVVGNQVGEYDRLALTLNGVIKRSKEDNEGLQPEKFEGYQILKENELVFKLIDLENVKTSRVGLSSYTGLVSPAYIVLTNESKDNRFYYYWFMFMYYNEVFNHLGGDGVRSALNAKDLTAIPVPFINECKQHRIADYLDEKCSKIDAIIKKQQTVIEKLKAYKLSVITETVTKGLNPDVEMKDSGVEWIGKIPYDWHISKIKNGTSKVGSGKTPKGGAEIYSENGVLFLRSQNIYDEGLKLNDPTYITPEIDEEMSNTRVFPGDVLLNITGGSIGRCCIFPEEIDHANVNQHVSILRVTNTLFTNEYLHYFWISILGKRAIEQYQTGGNREGMSADAIKNTPIPLPSIAEQNEIVKKLDSICQRVENTIIQKTVIIEKIEVYKKSLIFEVITGKKEV